jgi:hypothetical protein
MRSMAAAEPAVFAEFEPIRRMLLIFLRVVVATLALGACHNDHYAILFFCHVCLPANMK